MISRHRSQKIKRHAQEVVDQVRKNRLGREKSRVIQLTHPPLLHAPLPYLNSFRKRQQLRTFYHFPISQMSREFEIPRALLPRIRIQTQNKVPYGLCIKDNLYNAGNIMLEVSSPHQISSQSLILSHYPTYVTWLRNTTATYVMAFHGHPNVTLEAGPVSQLFKESPYFTLITFCHNDSFSSGNLQSHLHNNASNICIIVLGTIRSKNYW